MKIHRWNAINRLALLGIAMVAAVAMARPALADTLAVSADLPVSSSVTLKSAGSPATTYDSKSISGFTLGVSFPFLLGLGYENYSSSFSKSSTNTKFDYDVTMYDIFVNLPIPVVNIALGAGTGTGSVSHVNFPGMSSPFKDGDLTQWFASIGIPITPLVDVHVGYHSFSGKNKATTAAAASGFSDITVDGSMYSVGVKIGF